MSESELHDEFALEHRGPDVGQGEQQGRAEDEEAPAQQEELAGEARAGHSPDSVRRGRILQTGAARREAGHQGSPKILPKRQPDPRDRRANTLVVSSKSKKRISGFKKKHVQTMLKMFEALSDKEFEQYVALSKKILTSFSAEII